MIDLFISARYLNPGGNLPRPAMIYSSIAKFARDLALRRAHGINDPTDAVVRAD